MSHNHISNLPPHIAAATCHRLAQMGLVAPEAAANAILNCDVRADVSSCGRHARLHRMVITPIPDANLRRQAAAAARASLKSLINHKARWSTLRTIAQEQASAILTRTEIDLVIAQHISHVMRVNRANTN